MTINEAILTITQELERAEAKHPGWAVDQIHAAAAVAKESGELIQAALQYTYEDGNLENMKKKTIQAGAVIIRFLINCE